MRAPEGDVEVPYGELMDRRTREEWSQLSGNVLLARTRPNCCIVNRELESVFNREKHSPIAPAFGLWVADNFARDGHYIQAAKAYDVAIERAQTISDLPPGLDPSAGALFSKAKALALIGDVSTAVNALMDVRQYPSDAASAFLQGGLLLEESGEHQRAAELYSAFSSQKSSPHSEDPAEECRRALARLKDTNTRYFSSALELMEILTDALSRRDAHALTQLISRTHFAVGAMGGHTAYEDLELADELARDLAKSNVAVKRDLLGGNAKVYVRTTGWRGRWFRGDVFFLLTRAPQGWQWTGIGLSTPNDLWLDRWRPEKFEGNAPLPPELVLLAPWPEGEHFMAGGLDKFIGQMAVIQGVGPLAFWLAAGYSASRCGFGFRGYYYNMETTHVDNEEFAEAFAIDFSRYKRWVPFDNESGGTPVLAPRAGVVTLVRNTFDSNSDVGTGNRVHVSHSDPTNPADETRFTTRYLHLQGPFKIPVSEHMLVVAGNRLGLMDDTGKSLFDHLHFSIHDQQIPYSKWTIGASVRPSPMDGVRLGDLDSGTCIRSTNREVLLMREIAQYAVQNWLITPSALAVDEQVPSSRDQRFLLTLSGVALVDLQGLQGAQWTHETVSIRPSLWDPLSYAVGKWQLPAPAENYALGFETEQWVPIVTLSSVWNKDVSENSGFSVDAWRLNPWNSGQDATNQQLNQLFAGIQVDLAVQDIDAWILRIAYHIVLLGRIAYLPLGFTR